jgi:hypothetical protein
VDYCAALTGSLPWRCAACGTRFRSRGLPVVTLLSAHCSICGNYELKRIAAEHVNGTFSWLWRMLGIPAFRCIPCRHKFFSVRPLNKEVENDRWKMAS